MSFGFSLLYFLLFRIFGQDLVQRFLCFLNPITGHIIPLLIFIFYMPVVIKPLKNQNKTKILVYSLVILLVVFLSFVVSRFIENNISAFIGLKTLSSYSEPNNSVDKVYEAFELFLIGPFCEEIVYRVCFFRITRNKIGIFSHILTALLFSFQHISVEVILYGEIYKLLFLFSHLFFSLILTLAYTRLKTPVPGILAHVFYNSIQLLTR